MNDKKADKIFRAVLVLCFILLVIGSLTGCGNEPKEQKRETVWDCAGNPYYSYTCSHKVTNCIVAMASEEGVTPAIHCPKEVAEVKE